MPTPTARASRHRPRDGRPDSYGVSDQYIIGTLLAHLQPFQDIATDLASRTTNRSAAGCKAIYPAWVFVLIQAAVRVGSQRAAVTAIADSWRLVQLAAKATFPYAEALPDRPPKRHHWRYWFEQKLAPNVDHQLDAFVKFAIASAQDLGMLRPDQPLNLTQPVRSQLVTGDVKYYDSPSNQPSATTVDKETGEITTHRVDPASRLGKRGGATEMCWGSPFMTLSARGDGYHRRIILDLAYLQTGEGGEGTLLTSHIDRLRDNGAGIHGVLYDGALAGKHIEQLMQRGLLAISPVKAHTAGANGSKSKTGRVEKARRLRYITGPNGDCNHDLWADAGRPVLRHLNDRGEHDHQDLDYKLEYRAGVTRDRWYHAIRIPCAKGEKLVHGQRFHEHREPLLAQPDDAATRLNRSEYLRQIPPGSPAYVATYPYRNDSEAHHSTYDRSMDRGRVPAYGRDRQLAMLIGFALAENAITRAMWRTGEHGDAPPQTAAA